MATLKEDTLIVAGVAIALLGFAWYAKTKLGEAGEALSDLAGNAWDAAKDATKYVNPIGDQNLAYQGASSLTRWLTGQEDGTLGTIFYDYMHRGEPVPGGQPGQYIGNIDVKAQQEAIRQLETGFHGM